MIRGPDGRITRIRETGGHEGDGHGTGGCCDTTAKPRGHNKAVRAPDLERLCADARKTSLRGDRQSFREKAGLPTIPLVACEKLSPQTTAQARQEGVRVWVVGSLLDS